MTEAAIKLGKPSRGNASETDPGAIRLGKPPQARMVTETTACVPSNPAVVHTPMEIPVVRKPGFTLGEARTIDKEAAPPSQRVRPQVLVLFGVSLLLGLWMWFSGGGESSLRVSSPYLLREYESYLAQQPTAVRQQRQQEARQGLSQAAQAVERSDYATAREDLYRLLLLDRDTHSPIYRQCAEWLQQLPE